MEAFKIIEAVFGSPVKDPTPQRRIKTSFNKAEGFEMSYIPNIQMLAVKKNNFEALYPMTNIKLLVRDTTPTKARRNKKSG